MTDYLSPFVGRVEPLDRLRQLCLKRVASLVVVKGRRRIGKSRLIEEFARGRRFIEITGLSPHAGSTKISAQLQRDHFAEQLSAMTGLPNVSSNDWNSLFLLLARETQQGEVVILLDEISWMGSLDPAFLGKLKTAWDIYFKKNPQLILVLCGSVSSWIEENILRGPLFMGRVSLPLTLHELSLPSSVELLKSLGCQFSIYETCKLLAVTGGIPRYLEEVKPQMSAEENIRLLCFTPEGFLLYEFDDIFTDIFSTRSETYKSIVNLLVQKSATIADIASALKMSRSGHLSQCLDELEEAGMIKRYFTWSIKTGKASRLSQYRLHDNYLRFYLKYIDTNKNKIEQKHFTQTSLATLPGWQTMMGLQFETLVLNNRSIILDALYIQRENIVMDNPFFQRKTTTALGCQVDYLIQTRENVIYVCEIKFSKNIIQNTVADEVKEKIKRLHVPRGYSALPVLIHINGISEALENSEYFYRIIDFSDCINYTL